MGKQTIWFPNRSDTNRPEQAQKRARGLKFRIYVEEELYYPISENKDADQLRGYLICVFVFAYADCWFPHEAAHFRNVSVNVLFVSSLVLLTFEFCITKKSQNVSYK